MRASSPTPRRLWILGACGVCLAASVVCFNLLYLLLPDGWAPNYGFAPDIKAAYARVWPMPAATLAPRVLRNASLALQAAMWLAYLVAVALIIRLRDRDPAGEKSALRIVVVASAVAAVALIVTPPVLSGDLYHYALFGRMIITRGLNPYVTAGGVLVDDPLWWLANWRDYPTHYGPVFTGLSVVAAWAGAGSAVGTALAFKTLATVFGALTVWAAGALARRDDRSSLLPVLLIAWNPIALIETAGSGHNEMVMMGLALAGVYLMRQGRTNLGFVLLVCSVHVKWVTAALLGLVVIAHVRDIEGARARARALAKLAAIAAAVTVVVYVPFWAGADSMSAVRRLLVASPNASATDTRRLISLIPFVVLVVVAIAVVARRGRRFTLDMAAFVSVGFVLFVFSWIFPWYLLPAITLAAVGPLSRTNGSLLVGITACSVLLMMQWAVLLHYAR